LLDYHRVVPVVIFFKKQVGRTMANLKDVLKTLNKNRADVDQFKMASDMDEKHFLTEVVSTGSPYLDYKIQKEYGRGGLPRGRFTLIVGGEGSGKTSVTMLTAKNVQKEGKVVVYFDGEATVNQSYIDRFGIDKSLFLHYNGGNLEEMLDAAEALSTAEEVGMIIIDSIPIFTSKVVEDKSAEDNTIGIEAKKFNARMPIIYGNCTRRNIALVAINFYKKNPAATHNPNVLPRGEWQKYLASLTLEFTKKDLIKNKAGDVLGHNMDVRIKKSKLQEFDAKSEFTLKFYYESGFSKFDEYTDILMDANIIERGGAWYQLPTVGEVEGPKLQGRDAVVEFFTNNEEYLDSVIKKHLTK
jgi:protein RecA